MNNRRKITAILLLLAGIKLFGAGESTLGQPRSSVTLVGASSTLGEKYKRGGAPTVTVLESGGKVISAKDGQVNNYKGATYLQPMNLALPLKVQIQYSDAAYTMIVKDTNQQGTCPKYNTRVEAVVTGGTSTVTKSACLGKATSLFYGAGALQWQNIILAFADNPNYNADVRSDQLPFTFGISAWTSTASAWNKTKLTQDPDTGKKYDKGLRVIQGIPAWGSGEIPRAGFTHLGHIYVEAPYILLFERRDKNPTLKNYDFSELIPGSRGELSGSVAPFALAWLPKSPTDQAVSPESAIYVYPFVTPTERKLIDPSLLLDPGSALFPDGESSTEEVEQAIEDVKKSIKEDTLSLIDDELYSILSSDNVKNFLQSRYYYKIYSNGSRSKVIVEQHDIQDKLPSKVIYTYDQPAVAGNTPNFVRLLITHNSSAPKGEGDLNFEITALPNDLLRKK